MSDVRSSATPFGEDPAAAAQSEVESAQDTARALREQLEAFTQARSRAEAEARRLTVHAARPGADPALAELVRRYEHQSAVLTSEISVIHASLRGAETRLARLRG